MSSDAKGTRINVPYQEKEKVKSLGARWDAERKTWYVPHGIDLTKFVDWLSINDIEPPENVHTEILTEKQKEQQKEASLSWGTW